MKIVFDFDDRFALQYLVAQVKNYILLGTRNPGNQHKRKN